MMLKDHKILVTGGAGFIGTHIVQRLIDNGFTPPIVVDNLSSTTKNTLSLEAWGIRPYLEDIRNPILDTIFRLHKPKTVIHLAAQPSIQASFEYPIDDAENNILGIINLLRLCKRWDVEKLVFASTSAVYAPAKYGIYYEYNLCLPESPYGVSKLAAELYIKQSKIPHAILRLGNVFGPGQVPLGENQLIPRYLAHIYDGADFQVNGDGENARDFVYVEDVADAFLRAAFSDAEGIFNIGRNNPVSVLTVLEMINQITNTMRIPKFGPANPGELEKVQLYNEKALNEFGWIPKHTLKQGLEKTVEAWPK